MVDPNLADFYGRIARIEKARSKGFGFEASGTLGRSYYTYYSRSRRKGRFSIVKPVMVVLLCGFALKGAIHHQIGEEVYATRVAQLQGGEGFDRLGGYLMQADPVTIFVSTQIDKTFGYTPIGTDI